MNFKEYIKKIVKNHGYEVKSVGENSNPLVSLNFDLLLDVGASKGIYALNARSEGYSKRIVSFEPLSLAHSALKEAARLDRLWAIHERSAIGSEPGDIEINIAGNSVSSSILPILSSRIIPIHIATK